MQDDLGGIVLEAFQTSALCLSARAPDCIRIGDVREDVRIVHGAKSSIICCTHISTVGDIAR